MSHLQVEYCEKLGTRLVTINAKHVRELVRAHLELKALGIEYDFALVIRCDAKNAILSEVKDDSFEITVNI